MRQIAFESSLWQTENAKHASQSTESGVLTRTPGRSALPFLRQIAQIIIAVRLSVGSSIEPHRRSRRPGARRHDLLHHGNETFLVRLAQISHGLAMGRPSRFLHFA